MSSNAKVRVEVDREAIRQLLRSSEARDMLARKAKAVEDACNADSEWGGYHSAAGVGPDRARARVWSVGPAANEDNARNQRLVRNLSAGAGA